MMIRSLRLHYCAAGARHTDGLWMYLTAMRLCAQACEVVCSVEPGLDSGNASYYYCSRLEVTTCVRGSFADMVTVTGNNPIRHTARVGTIISHDQLRMGSSSNGTPTLQTSHGLYLGAETNDKFTGGVTKLCNERRLELWGCTLSDREPL